MLQNKTMTSVTSVVMKRCYAKSGYDWSKSWEAARFTRSQRSLVRYQQQSLLRATLSNKPASVTMPLANILKKVNSSNQQSYVTSARSNQRNYMTSARLKENWQQRLTPLAQPVTRPAPHSHLMADETGKGSFIETQNALHESWRQKMAVVLDFAHRTVVRLLTLVTLVGGVFVLSGVSVLLSRHASNRKTTEWSPEVNQVKQEK